jgi:hypothetical protein
MEGIQFLWLFCVWHSSKERTVVTSFYVFRRRVLHKTGFFHRWNFFIPNVESVDYTSVI